MRFPRPGLMALAAALALVVAAAGCGSSSQVPDSKLISELKLKKTARGYEIGGDPFCTVEQLLNTSDEVSSANDQASAAHFVIPSPDGKVGVLAQRPFAPDCTQKAKRKLKQLERRFG
ncbi:MAG: hypothetical protein ACRDK1_11050 [Solirubrobacterales bacterium]